ncbi:MAG TPA: hypothetical protein VFM02_04775 [Candidatus Paceibacterota bacterium]|nr:hypothetical protein [Candidatus Paceibacterota bacterium]
MEKAKILYDRSNGLMEKILENTRKAYEKGPEALTSREKDLYRKILNKFLRKAKSRPENPEYVLFGIAQFHWHALMYWSLVRGKWPLPIYRAGERVKEEDPHFYESLSVLTSPEKSDEEKIRTMEAIRNTLFWESRFGEG